MGFREHLVGLVNGFLPFPSSNSGGCYQEIHLLSMASPGRLSLVQLYVSRHSSSLLQASELT